jgi:oxaloacetate decarboxylase beta subunit
MACAVAGPAAKLGQAAVVGRPATSMLSLTANGIPSSGCASNAAAPSSRRRASQASAAASRSAVSALEIHAVAANVSGQIASVVAGGVILQYFANLG